MRIAINHNGALLFKQAESNRNRTKPNTHVSRIASPLGFTMLQGIRARLSIKTFVERRKYFLLTLFNPTYGLSHARHF